MKKLFVTLLFAGFISFIPSSLHSESLRSRYLITSSLSAQIPADGLVAWYPFNGNANDESGNGNHGTVNGATLTADRFGNVGSAYNFLGANDNKIVGNFSQPLSNVHSYSLWAKNNNSIIASKQWVFASGTPTISNAVHFGVSSNIVRIGSWGTDGLGTNGSISTNWKHYVVVCDNGIFSLYENGSLINEGLVKTTNIIGFSFEIGSQLGLIAESWDGQIDDLGVWSRVLSPSEIQQLYTTTSTTVGCNLGQIASVPTSICSGESVTLNATPGQSTQSNCFAPAVKSIGNAPQGSHKVVTDAQGNYYATGTFTGSITVGNTTLTSSGNRDAFLVKYNNCGVVQWAIKGGSSGEQDYPYSMTVDASGNVYWVGRYNQTFTINGTTGSFTAPYTSTSNGNHQDGFLVKLNANGGVVWGASCRGTSNDGFNGIALDNSGNPIVTGGFNGCCPSSFAVTIYGPNGNVGISSFGSNYGSGLIVKFDANGNILWKGSIYNRDTGLGSIAVDNNDNIYLTTSFRSWSNGTAAQFIDANNANYSIFNPGIGLGCLIKLNANGVYQWGQSFGNVGDGVSSLTAGTDVAIDANGNPWVCGYYKGNAAVFYSTNNQNLELPAAATYRGFLAQYSAAGVPFQVVGHERSTGDTYFYGLARGNGKWGVVGTFSGQTNGGLDAMLVEFNDNLTVANAENTGSSGDDSWNSVVYNATDFVLWGGMGGAVTIANESVSSASAVLWNRGGGSVVSNNNYTWSTGESNTSVTVSPTQTTTYTCTFSDGTNSCSDEVTVTVLPNVTNTVSASIIQGEMYILGAQTLTTAGTYTEVFTAANGCDSTVTLTLAVEPALTCAITPSSSLICEGESLQLSFNYNINGQTINSNPPNLSGYNYYGEFNNRWYYIATAPSTWTYANAAANAAGGYLVCIDNQAEQDYVANITPLNIWLGFRRNINTDIWEWVNGQPVTYTNWRGGEPNGSGPNGEQFAQMLTDNCFGINQWNDLNDISVNGACYSDMYGVIEVPKTLAFSVLWNDGSTSESVLVSPGVNSTFTCTANHGNSTCTASVDITVNPISTWYADADGDGFGENLTTAEGCDQPAGFVADNNDCNDADATVFPNAEEICFDGMDNNCDGAVDENCAIFGCTNPEACNFNANATAEDGSCILPQPYFNCDGNCINDSDGDGVCDELEVSGCTDSTAFNFNPQATNDDGSCEAVLACDIATSSTTICEGNETSIVFSSSDINSGTTTLLEGTWMKRLNSSEMPVILSIGGSSYDQEGNIVYSIHKSSTTNIFSRIDLNDFSIQNQSPNGGPAELYGHVYDPVQNRILATRAGRDQVYQLNVNSPTAWALFGSGSFDSESYSCRTFYDASVGGMGFFAGYGWFSSKNWIFKNGGGSWIQARPNQNDCVVQKRREGHYSAANPTSILGAPGSNEVYFFSGAGSCTGVQNGAVCNGGSPFNDQIGTYCWLKDILKYNTVSGLFETILPPGNSAVPLEGDLVYDYERSTFYLLGGFVPPATNITNFKSITDYQNKVFKYNPAVDEEFVEIQMSGSFPDIKKLDFIGAHCGYFDALNDRIVWVRSDGIWSFDLVTTQADILWSTGETTPNITVSPTQTTTYTATVTTATQTCTDSITITVNPLLTWYADADADGFGNPDDVVQDCNQPLGYITDNTDCNDEDAATYPGADEICDNNRDENCDGVDSLCFVVILGCIDLNACNFNPDANTEDGSCILPQPETCNGLDDNCNGQIDEGLSAAAINAVSATTALYPVCSGNSIRPANLNNGANSAVIDGNGNDLWYSFTALYNTFRAGLSAASGDNDVRLYTMTPGGCLELIETEHENTNGNQTLLSDQLIVGQTYYVAVHNISGPMNASAKICFNHLTGSTCDHYYSNNTGIYTSVCNSFKAQYRANAVAYTFDILSATQNNVNQNITPWSYTTTSASTVVARLGALLPANQGSAPVVYTLRVPVLYSLFDAAGNFENLFAQATTNCTVTLNAEPTIALRSSDRCPTNKSLTSTIAPDRTVCGAMRYDWEFTEVLPNPGTAQVVQGGNYTTVFFLSNVPGITAGKTYSVRVRPVHSSGIAGQWGSAQCLRVGAAGMIQQSESESENVFATSDSPIHRFTDSPLSLYPNPTSTGSFVLQYNGKEMSDEETSDEDRSELVMMDITGKIVFKTQVVLDGNAVEIEFGSLASGVYIVMVGEERMRLVVQ